MGYPKLNVVGKRFDKLFVLDTYRRDNHGTKLHECLCDCGRRHFATSSNLVYKGVTQCRECSKTRYVNNRTTTYELTNEGYVIGITGSKGDRFMFSARHLPLVSQYSWYVSKNGIVSASGGTKKPDITIHRLIMNTLHIPRGAAEVDHINGNKLDNRDENLRLATRQQNCMNKAKFYTRPTSSKYKGVCWITAKNRWLAKIQRKGEVILLGHYKTEEDAARAYNEAAKIYHGQFARLNKIGGTNDEE